MYGGQIDMSAYKVWSDDYHLRKGYYPSNEEAFYAGMACAMDIVVEPIVLTAGNERKNLILAQAAATIQKEIE
jgi:hypothetical protein